MWVRGNGWRGVIGRFCGGRFKVIKSIVLILDNWLGYYMKGKKRDYGD